MSKRQKQYQEYLLTNNKKIHHLLDSLEQKPAQQACCIHCGRCDGKHEPDCPLNR